MMQAYPPAPPPPRRSGFPFVLCGCLVAFVTLCAVLVIGVGAAALAFVSVSASGPAVSANQTADLFFLQMSAGKWSEASRLVSPGLAGSVAGIGEENRAVWGENRGCSASSMRSNLECQNGSLRHVVKATLQYTLKGTDGVSRKVALKVENGLITDLSVDGKVLLGGPIYSPGCTIVPAPAAVVAPKDVAEPEQAPEVKPPAPKKKTT